MQQLHGHTQPLLAASMRMWLLANKAEEGIVPFLGGMVVKMDGWLLSELSFPRPVQLGQYWLLAFCL